MLTRRTRDPLRSGSDILSLRRAMDHLLEQSFVDPAMLVPNMLANMGAQIAAMDVCETEKGYEVDVALPGVRAEDIELTVDQNMLTIRGTYSHQEEHGSEPSQQQGQQMDGGQQAGQNGGQQAARHPGGHNWLMREMVSGTFERTITFPRPIDANNIQTMLENGILTIMLPISEASRPKRLSVSEGKSQSQPQVNVGTGQPQRQ